MIEPLVFLCALVALPSIVGVASATSIDAERLRKLAVVVAGALLLVTLTPSFRPALATFAIGWGADLGPFFGATALRLGVLSRALLPLAAGLWLLTVAVTPRARLDRAGLRRTAVATLVTHAAFLTTSPFLLFVTWSLSVWTYLRGHGAPEHRPAQRVAAAYLGFATIAFAAGIACLTLFDAPAVVAVGPWLIALAALIRKGIFPFHAWIPDGFDRGRLGPSVLFSAPQIGAYVVAVLVVPLASPTLLRLVASLALFTAVYAAALALHQRDARRAAGYLFVSQSALVMAGLDCSSHEALAGSLLLWVSSALAFAGLGRCILVLEARRGRLDLARHHGGYEQMPMLAVSFLIMGLACMGFPGTLGFIAQELLVSGATDTLGALGFCVIGAGALTGVAVLRMYFSLFCGRRDASVHLGARPRETVAFVAVAVVLVGFGLAPRALVSSRLDAARELLAPRHQSADQQRVNRSRSDRALLRHPATSSKPISSASSRS